VSAAAVGAVGTPVKAGEANGAFVAKLLVIVVAKFASSPNARANSLRVSSAAGEPLTTLATAEST
jgi:hypothetical protein